MSTGLPLSPDAWPLPPFKGLSFHRVVSVPRPRGGDGDMRGQGLSAARAPLIATLMGARTLKTPIIVAWVRPRPHVPLDVYVGGGASVAEESVEGRHTPEADAALLYPPGSRGIPVAAEAVEDLLCGMGAWVRCHGVDDHLLLRADDDHPMSTRRAPFEDYVAYLSGHSFAWLVVGEPLETVGEEMDRLLNRIPEAYANRANSEDDRLRAERDRARYRELLRARALGLWNVHVLVGAADELEVRRVSALLCGGSDLGRLPYALYPGTEIGPLATIRAGSANDSAGAASPFQATAELLAALGRPPEQEIPGIRLVTPPTFDVTRETTQSDVQMGVILDGSLRSAGPFFVSKGTLNRHTFVCGATGSGKSQTVRALLEDLATLDPPIPWLVIEPAKAEYARMAGRLIGRSDVLVIRPGASSAIPASLNPLEREAGFPLQTHIDLVRALFLAAFEAEEPFPQVLSYALTRCYQDLGWDLALGKSKVRPFAPRYPTLGDLQTAAREVVASIGYSQRVTDDVRGFIDVRIGSLRLGTPGRFFEGGHPLDIAALLRRNTVIEIEDVGNDQDKAFLIGTVLIRLVEHLRVRSGEEEGPIPLSHVTVVEEAHRLLKNALPGSQAAHAVELFAGLLAEIRAYGEGIVVAEQIPSKIMSDVIKNTALKVMHRLPAQDDRDSVGATMNLDDEQSAYVVTLPPGMSAVFTDGMDRPVLIQMPLGEARESAKRAVRDVPLIGRRSVACGPMCRNNRACTLEEMTEASWLAEDARLSLWIEMIVVAHLTGLSRPSPDRAWLGNLRRKARLHRRTVECAIGQCAQSAIDARYSELIHFFQPEDLAVHAGLFALDQLDGQRVQCSLTSEVGFQAGPYRWMDVRAALEQSIKGGNTGPHPLTETWRARGLTLIGATPDKQIESLRADAAMRRPKRAVLYGTRTPSYIEDAVSKLSAAPEWTDRLRVALGFLTFRSIWPLQYLGKQTPISKRKLAT